MANQGIHMRLSSRARAGLAELAMQEGRTPAGMVEALVERALNDPEGYYLRLAAHQSWLAAMVSLNQLHESLGQDEFARRVGSIIDQSKKLFGEPPRIPNDHFEGTEPNPVITAMLKMGAIRPPAAP